MIEGPPGTPYQGGQFKVKLVLSKDYPTSPPKGFFLTKIFHPNVGPSGEICVNTLKKDWKPDMGIRHILMVIKCLLIVPNPESALNEEAGKLLLEQYDTYFNRAKLYTEIHASVKSSSSKTEVSFSFREHHECFYALTLYIVHVFIHDFRSVENDRTTLSQPVAMLRRTRKENSCQRTKRGR